MVEDYFSRRRVLESTIAGTGMLLPAYTGVSQAETKPETGLGEYREDQPLVGSLQSTAGIRQNAEVRNGGGEWKSNSSLELSNTLTGSYRDGDWDNGMGITTFGKVADIRNNTVKVKFRTINASDTAQHECAPFGIIEPGDTDREYSVLVESRDGGLSDKISAGFWEYSENTTTYTLIREENVEIFDGEWHEIIMSVNYDKDRLRLYFDGEFLDERDTANWTIEESEIWGVGLSRKSEPDIEISKFEWINKEIQMDEEHNSENTIAEFPCLFGGPVAHRTTNQMMLDHGQQSLSDIYDQIMTQTEELTNLYSSNLLTLPSSQYLTKTVIDETIEQQTQKLLDDIVDKKTDGKLDKQTAMEILERIRCERHINKIAMANLSSESLSRNSSEYPLHSRTLVGVKESRFASNQSQGLNHRFVISLAKFLLTIYIVGRGVGIAARGAKSAPIPTDFKMFGAADLVIDLIGLGADLLEEFTILKDLEDMVSDAPDPDDYSSENEFRRALDEVITDFAKPLENIFNLMGLLGISGITSVIVEPLQRRTTIQDIHESFREVNDRGDLQGDLAGCRDAVAGSTTGIEQHTKERINNLEGSVIEVLTDIAIRALFRWGAEARAVAEVSSEIATSPASLSFGTLELTSILKHMSYVYGENSRGLTAIKEGDY